MAKILLLEDDVEFAEGLVDWLTRERHVVDHAACISDAKEFIRTYDYDLFVFDWELPDGSGAELCRETIVEARTTTSPVIMLTARTQLESKILGLDCGANDYVCKPCEAGELSARIRAILRRNAPDAGAGDLESMIVVEDLQINTTARTVEYRGSQIHLSPTEFDILEVLARAGDRRISADSIVARCGRGHASKLSRSSVKVYVSNIRKKLNEVDANLLLDATTDGYGLQVRNHRADEG